MRKILETIGARYEWYKVRRVEYESNQKIPFLVAPKPLLLSQSEGEEVARIGEDIVNFMYAADELYHAEAEIKDLLDRGKPKFFQGELQTRYLFAKPDLIVTDTGFSVCEIETSPFGLALAELLNKGYRSAGFDTMVGDGVLRRFLSENTPAQGTIVYSQKTSSYAGQLEFLAKELFSGNGRRWEAKQVSEVSGDVDNFYRGFYQHEYLENESVRNLTDSILENGADKIIPSFTPHAEEKALLALLWDKRWEQFLKNQLGISAFKHLREVIPPTWVIGQERYFVPGLPSGVSSSREMSTLTGSKRRFVLKKSGFGNGSSWAEGVTFLHEKSIEAAKTLLVAAEQDAASLYVLQEFRPAQKRFMSYQRDDGIDLDMQARIRVTPYFSMIGGARLIAIKATGCEKTNYIHASTGSINTAVAVVK